MFECLGCKREFLSLGGLNSHKRFCKEWRTLGLSKRDQRKGQTLEEVKNVQSTCPLCEKIFVNVFSMSAHKGHCSGKNNTTQLDSCRAWSKDKVLKPVEEIFVVCKKRNTAYVKRALIKLGIKKEICENCELKEWLGEKIAIEVDHIDGNNLNNQLDNLRFLCPNCHSQTPTWRGRNIKNKKI
jgi:Zn finger protein HypA/HybF involved in hydrogenase expression